MKKVFLVTLNFGDNNEYESMDFKTNIAVFTDEEKANDFCKDNSDNEEPFVNLVVKKLLILKIRMLNIIIIMEHFGLMLKN